MNDANAMTPDGVTQDSAPGDQDRAGGDSTLDGQDVQQGSADNRVNNLMSLANKRLAERDAALARVEELRQMLDEASHVQENAQHETLSQMDFLYGEPVDEAPPDAVWRGEAGADPASHIDTNAAPRRPREPVQSQSQSNPGATFLRDQSDLAATRRELDRQGHAWAMANGLTLD